MMTHEFSMLKAAKPVVLVCLFAACGSPPPKDQTVAAPEMAEAALFAALPVSMESPANPRTAEKVALGRMLYYDTRFSTDGTISCYVCHPLHDYGTSHRATGVGHTHLPGSRNDPTVYNAAGQIAQFWDGRAPDVEAQALGPVLNKVEMGMPGKSAVVGRILSIPGYVAAFNNAFPGEADPVTFENFGRAIAAFERGLVTPSRWDEYLKGDRNALSAAEKQGLRTFVSAGCAQCHKGAYVGGDSFQRLGIIEPWSNENDIGRAAVTKDDADLMVFKVPSLRNITQTWPYFHDGSVLRLDDAIALMARHQTGRELTPAQIAQIHVWLQSLTGTIPFDYIDEPTLPPDGKASGVALLR